MRARADLTDEERAEVDRAAERAYSTAETLVGIRRAIDGGAEETLPGVVAWLEAAEAESNRRIVAIFEREA